jgi:hypothetical protein
VSRPVSALVPLTADEAANLQRATELMGMSAVHRGIGVTDHTVRAARSGKPVSARSAGLIRTWLASLSLSIGLSACAGTLPVLSTGLDAAKPVIAQACPERTAPCERVLLAYNAGISAYNLAVLAEAVGEDATQLEQQGMASLKSLWAALQDVAK